MIKEYSVQRDGEQKLSSDFRVREFACKDGSDIVFIDTDLVLVLQAIRAHFGMPVIINSAYRTEAYNKKVGGTAYSQHMFGKAADIVVSGISPEEVYAYADSLLLNGGVGKYNSFTHVDVRDTRSRWIG